MWSGRTTCAAFPFYDRNDHKETTMSNLFFKGSRDSVMLPLTAKCWTEAGGIYNINFKGRFRRPNQDERREIAEGIRSEALRDDDVVEKLLIGWADVKDKDDEPIEFTPENVAAALQEPAYREALVRGALTMIYGKEIMLEAERRKNSQKPAAAG